MIEEQSTEQRVTHILFNSFSKYFISDFRKKLVKIKADNLLFNISVIIFLLSLGILVRLLLAYYFRIEFYSGIVYDNIWLRDVNQNPLGYPIVGFNDFSHYYYSWVEAWYNNQWNPYIWVGEELIQESPLYLYSYTPFFLYFLALFYRPNFHILWLALPLIASDAACACIVYLILRKIVKGTKSLAISFFTGLIMVFTPINILYNGVYFLNPGPVTLLSLIVIYFAIDKKWWQCFFCLALATLTKQNALFLTFPIFMMMFGSKVENTTIKKAVGESIMNVLLFIFTFICGSNPWLFISPKYYIYHLAIPGKYLTLNTIIEDPGARCIPFSFALQSIGIKGWILDFVAFGINSMFLFAFTSIIISIILMWRAFSNKISMSGFVELITIYLILTHLFLPRGVFKFYSTYFMPFLIITLFNSMAKIIKNEIILILSLLSISLLFFESNLWLIIIERKYFPLILFGLCLIIIILGISRTIIQKNIKEQNLKIKYI